MTTARKPSDARILAIDDEPANLALVEAVLTREGYRYFEALTEPRFAAERHLAFKPDLVLLDLHLPDRDGNWVLRELGASFPDLPVILLTADALAAQSDWISRGAAAVLTKPIDVPALLEAVEQAIMERES